MHTPISNVVLSRHVCTHVQISPQLQFCPSARPLTHPLPHSHANFPSKRLHDRVRVWMLDSSPTRPIQNLHPHLPAPTTTWRHSKHLHMHAKDVHTCALQEPQQQSTYLVHTHKLHSQTLARTLSLMLPEMYANLHACPQIKRGKQDSDHS